MKKEKRRKAAAPVEEWSGDDEFLEGLEDLRKRARSWGEVAEVMDTSRETLRNWRNGGAVPFGAAIRQLLVGCLCVDWNEPLLNANGKTSRELAVITGLDKDSTFAKYI